MFFCIYCLLFTFGVFLKGVRAQVQTHQTVMAAVGEEAQFSCLLTESKEVVKVIWQKVLPNCDKNVATYSKLGQRVEPDFEDRVKFKVTELQNSSIVIRNITEQDEGCYLCLFITYPDGSLSGRTCLQVYELHEPVLHVRESNSPEESVVSCSVTARPAPTVTLTVTQQHLYFYNYSTVTVTNTNNTLTVTKTAVLSGLRGDGTQVGCAVRVGSGPQKEVFLTMTEVKQTPDGWRWIWLVLGLVIVLCLLIFFFFWFRNQKPLTREDTNLATVQTEPTKPAASQKAEVRKRTPPNATEEDGRLSDPEMKESNDSDQPGEDLDQDPLEAARELHDLKDFIVHFKSD